MISVKHPRIPIGLRDLMKTLTREVLREKPSNIYEFSAQYFESLLDNKSNYEVDAYEPRVSDEVLIKNRSQYPIPLPLVLSIIPDSITELIKTFIKAVLKENPTNLCEFAVEYFRLLHKAKGDIYKKVEYTNCDNYFNGKGVHVTTNLKCTCGRIVGNNLETNIKSSPNDDYDINENNNEVLKLDVNFEKSNISENNAESTILINDDHNSNETYHNEKYIKSIYVLQRFFRRCLQKKLQNSENEENPDFPIDTQTNLMSEESAAIIIQHALRKMFNKKIETSNQQYILPTAPPNENVLPSESVSLENVDKVLESDNEQKSSVCDGEGENKMDSEEISENGGIKEESTQIKSINSMVEYIENTESVDNVDEDNLNEKLLSVTVSEETDIVESNDQLMPDNSSEIEEIKDDINDNDDNLNGIETNVINLVDHKNTIITESNLINTQLTEFSNQLNAEIVSNQKKIHMAPIASQVNHLDEVHRNHVNFIGLDNEITSIHDTNVEGFPSSEQLDKKDIVIESIPNSAPEHFSLRHENNDLNRNLSPNENSFPHLNIEKEHSERTKQETSTIQEQCLFTQPMDSVFVEDKTERIKDFAKDEIQILEIPPEQPLTIKSTTLGNISEQNEKCLNNKYSSIELIDPNAEPTNASLSSLEKHNYKLIKAESHTENDINGKSNNDDYLITTEKENSCETEKEDKISIVENPSPEEKIDNKCEENVTMSEKSMQIQLKDDNSKADEQKTDTEIIPELNGIDCNPTSPNNDQQKNSESFEKDEITGTPTQEIEIETEIQQTNNENTKTQTDNCISELNSNSNNTDINDAINTEININKNIEQINNLEIDTELTNTEHFDGSENNRKLQKREVNYDNVVETINNGDVLLEKEDNIAKVFQNHSNNDVASYQNHMKDSVDSPITLIPTPIVLDEKENENLEKSSEDNQTNLFPLEELKTKNNKDLTEEKLHPEEFSIENEQQNHINLEVVVSNGEQDKIVQTESTTNNNIDSQPVSTSLEKEKVLNGVENVSEMNGNDIGLLANKHDFNGKCDNLYIAHTTEPIINYEDNVVNIENDLNISNQNGKQSATNGNIVENDKNNFTTDDSQTINLLSNDASIVNKDYLNSEINVNSNQCNQIEKPNEINIDEKDITINGSNSIVKDTSENLKDDTNLFSNIETKEIKEKHQDKDNIFRTSELVFSTNAIPNLNGVNISSIDNNIKIDTNGHQEHENIGGLPSQDHLKYDSQVSPIIENNEQVLVMHADQKSFSNNNIANNLNEDESVEQIPANSLDNQILEKTNTKITDVNDDINKTRNSISNENENLETGQNNLEFDGVNDVNINNSDHVHSTNGSPLTKNQQSFEDNCNSISLINQNLEENSPIQNQQKTIVINPNTKNFKNDNQKENIFNNDNDKPSTNSIETHENLQLVSETPFTKFIKNDISSNTIPIKNIITDSTITMEHLENGDPKSSVLNRDKNKEHINEIVPEAITSEKLNSNTVIQISKTEDDILSSAHDVIENTNSNQNSVSIDSCTLNEKNSNEQVEFNACCESEPKIQSQLNISQRSPETGEPEIFYNNFLEEEHFLNTNQIHKEPIISVEEQKADPNIERNMEKINKIGALTSKQLIVVPIGSDREITSDNGHLTSDPMNGTPNVQLNAQQNYNIGNVDSITNDDQILSFSNINKTIIGSFQQNTISPQPEFDQQTLFDHLKESETHTSEQLATIIHHDNQLIAYKNLETATSESLPEDNSFDCDSLEHPTPNETDVEEDSLEAEPTAKDVPEQIIITQYRELERGATYFYGNPSPETISPRHKFYKDPIAFFVSFEDENNKRKPKPKPERQPKLNGFKYTKEVKDNLINLDLKETLNSEQKINQEEQYNEIENIFQINSSPLSESSLQTIIELNEFESIQSDESLSEPIINYEKFGINNENRVNKIDEIDSSLNVSSNKLDIHQVINELENRIFDNRNPLHISNYYLTTNENNNSSNAINMDKELSEYEKYFKIVPEVVNVSDLHSDQRQYFNNGLQENLNEKVHRTYNKLQIENNEINDYRENQLDIINAVISIQRFYKNYISHKKHINTSKSTLLDSKQNSSAKFLEKNCAASIIQKAYRRYKNLKEEKDFKNLKEQSNAVKVNWFVGEEPIATTSDISDSKESNTDLVTIFPNTRINSESTIFVDNKNEKKLITIIDKSLSNENSTKQLINIVSETEIDLRDVENGESYLTNKTNETDNVNNSQCTQISEPLNSLGIIKEFIDAEKEYSSSTATLSSPMNTLFQSIDNIATEDTPDPKLFKNINNSDENNVNNGVDNTSPPLQTSLTEASPLTSPVCMDITEKFHETDEMIVKMQQRRSSESNGNSSSSKESRDISFDEPIIKSMKDLYSKESVDELRQSESEDDVVLKESKDILEDMVTVKSAFKRLHTIAGDSARSAFKSVTIDDDVTIKFIDPTETEIFPTNNSSFYLDDTTSKTIREKMMAYSLSEADSDYFENDTSHKSIIDKKKPLIKDDFNISTALLDNAEISTETESTIVSAVTKIQANARGFLTRRRLQRSSGNTKSTNPNESKASFGNEAINDSLDKVLEYEAAKKIQRAYRKHFWNRDKKIYNLGKDQIKSLENINDQSAELNSLSSIEKSLAERRLTLQRGDAMQDEYTPYEDATISKVNKIKTQAQSNKPPKLWDSNGAQSLESNKSESKYSHINKNRNKKIQDKELKWLAMRQNSMPVQIDFEVFRPIPKHMRKRIKSAESDKKRRQRKVKE